MARYINEVANRAFDEREPFVGGSAFTHKAGMHVDAVYKDPASFEHIDPALVGNERNILVTSLSGRSAMTGRFREMPALIFAAAKNAAVSDQRYLERSNLASLIFCLFMV